MPIEEFKKNVGRFYGETDESHPYPKLDEYKNIKYNPYSKCKDEDKYNITIHDILQDGKRFDWSKNKDNKFKHIIKKMKHLYNCCGF
jgi:hypothetical protein